MKISMIVARSGVAEQDFAQAVDGQRYSRRPVCDELLVFGAKLLRCPLDGLAPFFAGVAIPVGFDAAQVGEDFAVAVAHDEVGWNF